MRLNAELHAILAMPNARERLAVLGLEPVPSSPEEHAAEIKAEFAHWKPITKALGMRID
jgi:tripartite-type tricarboxylate transporter receptor subunit TctC